MSRKRSHKRKKRALDSQRQQEPSHRAAPPQSRDERVLRERILRFTYQERFRADFKRAVRLYFGQETLQDDVLTLDEEKAPGFQQWYIHDYITSEGERIIDLFAREKGPRLPTAQRQMLDDWRRTNHYRLFEVQAVEPGVGVTVQDLLNGEVLEINDISSSYALVKWQVVLTRPLLTEGRLCFTGTGLPLTPMAKSGLLEFARGLWEAYQAQHSDASLAHFYQDHGLDLYHRVMEIASVPPPVYTPEGHLLMGCEARYAVTAPQAVRERLDQAEEFSFAGLDADDSTALHYNWILRGRSQVLEISVEGGGLIMRTDWTAGPGGPTYRSLGDVQLWHNQLELSCFSQERLEAGKTLLKQILGRLIRHQDDEFRDLDTMLESAEPSAPDYEEEIEPEVEEALLRKMMTTQRAEWPDTPIPALDGTSPRAAARDPAMREQMEELLKSVEYIEEQKRREGAPHIDVADLRRELGLPPR